MKKWTVVSLLAVTLALPALVLHAAEAPTADSTAKPKHRMHRKHKKSVEKKGDSTTSAAPVTSTNPQ